MCNYCWKMLFKKKQSEFVQQLNFLNKESIAPFQRSDVRVFADLFWTLRMVRWTFNAEKYVGNPSPELCDFVHIRPNVWTLVSA